MLLRTKNVHKYAKEKRTKKNHKGGFIDELG